MIHFIPPLSHATKLALSFAFMGFLLVAGVAVSYAIAAHLTAHSAIAEKAQLAQSKADEQAAIKAAVAYSNSQWCDTLTLLTKVPVPEPVNPKANPSREGQYLFYVNLVKLKDRFDCKGAS